MREVANRTNRVRSKISPKRAAAAERQAQALSLRAAGVSYPAIAETLGYANAGGAWKAVTAGLRSLHLEPAQEVVTLELSRIDAALVGIWPKVRSGDTQATNAFVRLSELRAKWQGVSPNSMVVAHQPVKAESVLVIGGDRESYIDGLRQVREARGDLEPPPATADFPPVSPAVDNGNGNGHHRAQEWPNGHQ